jgi:hypothetical protein
MGFEEYNLLIFEHTADVTLPFVALVTGPEVWHQIVAAGDRCQTATGLPAHKRSGPFQHTQVGGIISYLGIGRGTAVGELTRSAFSPLTCVGL